MISICKCFIKLIVHNGLLILHQQIAGNRVPSLLECIVGKQLSVCKYLEGSLTHMHRGVPTQTTIGNKYICNLGRTTWYLLPSPFQENIFVYLNPTSNFNTYRLCYDYILCIICFWIPTLSYRQNKFSSCALFAGNILDSAMTWGKNTSPDK